MVHTDQDPNGRRAEGVADTSEAQAQSAIELDRRLDEALQASFPASDPISLSHRRPERAGEF